jgi:hypothetical protein
MASYNWDIGFKLTDPPDPGNYGLPPLLQGCVGFDDQNLPFRTPVVAHLDPGDTLCFNAFNLTANAQPGDCKVVGYKIAFSKGSGAQSESPFDSAVFELNCAQLSTGLAPSEGLSCGPVPAYCPVVYLGPTQNEGGYNFTFWLTVLGPDNKNKQFRVDPEMVVGSVG